MPKGKYVNHKGRNRHFTSPEEMNKEDDEESTSEEENEDGSGSEESSEEEDHKKKGVSGLIQIENPNRAKPKTSKVASVATESPGPSAKPELSRREREELEKQRAQAHYQKLHSQGATEQARADLARLAIIKQRREEAAAKRANDKSKDKAATQK